MEKERVIESRCLLCGAKLDGVTGLESPHPSPGDVSICIYCSNIAIYGDDLRLRKPTPEEKDEIAKDRTVKEALSLIAKAQQRN